MVRYIVSIRHFLTLYSVNKTHFDAYNVNKTRFDEVHAPEPAQVRALPKVSYPRRSKGARAPRCSLRRSSDARNLGAPGTREDNRTFR